MIRIPETGIEHFENKLTLNRDMFHMAYVAVWYDLIPSAVQFQQQMDWENYRGKRYFVTYQRVPKRDTPLEEIWHRGPEGWSQCAPPW